MVTELLSSASNSSTLRRCSSSAAGVVASSSVSTQSSSSSSVFDSLCNELLVEIIQRLPLKTVHRCKCLSKRWLITISSTGFVRCYVRYHHNQGGGGGDLQPFALFYQYRDSECGTITPDQMGVHLVTTTLPQHPNHHSHTLFNSTGFTLNFISPPKQQQQDPIRILAVSNGLVLCSSTFIFQTQYFVCNPLTRHWLALPPPPTCKKFIRIGFICRTTTTTTSFRVVRVRDYGYDYDEPSSSSTPTGLELFSSKRWKWTKISLSKAGQKQKQKQVEQKQIRQSLACPMHSKAVVCGGILHWHSVWGTIFAYDPYERSSCQVIGLPKNINTRADDYYFGECNGRLRYIQFDLLTFTLWELNDYLKEGAVEWCLLKQVSMDQMVSEDPWIVNYIKRSYHPFLHHLAFHPFDGDIVFLSFIGRIVQCNMRTKTLESVCHLDHANAHLFDSMVFPIVLPAWPTPLSSIHCKLNLL